jgi:hypothetical protein
VANSWLDAYKVGRMMIIMMMMMMRCDVPLGEVLNCPWMR